MFEFTDASRERPRVTPRTVMAILFGLFMLGLMAGMLLGSGKASREWDEWGILFFVGMMLWRLSAPVLHEFRTFLKDRNAH